MKKKLSVEQLKRDAKTGRLKAVMKIRCGIPITPALLNFDSLAAERKILGANRRSLIFWYNGRESYLELPRANLVEYMENTLTIFYPGYREPNEKEREVLEEWESYCSRPEIKKRFELDAISDSSSMYYTEKNFFHKHGMEYLMGLHEEKGLYLDHNRKNRGNPDYIRDAKIRGNVEMLYQIIRDIT